MPRNNFKVEILQSTFSQRWQNSSVLLFNGSRCRSWQQMGIYLACRSLLSLQALFSCSATCPTSLMLFFTWTGADKLPSKLCFKRFQSVFNVPQPIKRRNDTQSHPRVSYQASGQQGEKSENQPTWHNQRFSIIIWLIKSMESSSFLQAARKLSVDSEANDRQQCSQTHLGDLCVGKYPWQRGPLFTCVQASHL